MPAAHLTVVDTRSAEGLEVAAIPSSNAPAWGPLPCRKALGGPARRSRGSYQFPSSRTVKIVGHMP